MVPIDRFRIPGLIIAPGISPQKFSDIASQIDLIPTIMPMLGVALDSPTLGRDLLAPNLPQPGRALMQYGNNIGLLWGDRMVVNTPKKVPVYFKHEATGLVPSAPHEDVQELARAYLTLANQLYQNRSYRMPDAVTQP